MKAEMTTGVDFRRFFMTGKGNASAKPLYNFNYS
jgi:hypothetical protein